MARPNSPYEVIYQELDDADSISLSVTALHDTDVTQVDEIGRARAFHRYDV